ncbi:hypothetical protein AKO1_012572 [Acrasis kona]|uniref:Uncharacterized protein n=1 Tax=Acrasis kona TaxID=1008807 RepID=A0AAW2YWY5_9EUKA
MISSSTTTFLLIIALVYCTKPAYKPNVYGSFVAYIGLEDRPRCAKQFGDAVNERIRIDNYVDQTQSYVDYKADVEYVLVYDQGDLVTCLKRQAQENLFKTPIFTNATFVGVTTMRDHIVDKWYNKEVNITMWIDSKTTLPVRLDTDGEYPQYYEIVSDKSPDLREFELPESIKETCTNNK